MRSGLLVVGVLLLSELLSGCAHTDGNDNSLLPARPTSSPAPSYAPPATDDVPAPSVTTPTATPSSTPTGFPDYIVPCNGTPTGAQVIALVRRQPDLLPSGATVKVQSGPSCTGTWQYTVLVVGDREPLQVVTKGIPPAITFVTAGTDVCTVDVRATAPAALLNLADCSVG